MRSRFLSPALLLFLVACVAWPSAPIFLGPGIGSRNHTPTRTPFQPEGRSALTALPSVTRNGAYTATPERVYPTLQAAPVGTQAPAPAALIPQPEGQISLLLLGSDQRPGSGSFRTDTIVLVIVKPDGAVSMVSIPRDLYVYIPGFRMSRINAAYIWGGFDLLAMTFEYNFGLRPQHFVLTNFNGFKSIVDSLGGVDVNVGRRMHDARSGYPGGYIVNPGVVHMNGEMALWYLRARAASSDLDRLRRNQEVLVAIGQKLLSLDALGRVPDFYNAYRQAVVTDFSLSDLLQFPALLQATNPGQVDRYTLTLDHTAPWTEPGSGTWYLLPKTEAIQGVLHQAMGAP